jgi:hypothetical protein
MLVRQNDGGSPSRDLPRWKAENELSTTKRGSTQRIAAALPNDEMRRIFEVAEPVRLLGRMR